MVPSVRIALTTCIALVVIGIEARKTQRSGPTPAPPDRHRAAIFSFAANAAKELGAKVIALHLFVVFFSAP